MLLLFYGSEENRPSFILGEWTISSFEMDSLLTYGMDRDLSDFFYLFSGVLKPSQSVSQSVRQTEVVSSCSKFSANFPDKQSLEAAFKVVA